MIDETKLPPHIVQAAQTLEQYFKFGGETAWRLGGVMAVQPEHAHILFETGDPFAPDKIKDQNGEVVLSMCCVCGKAEVELSEPCVPPATLRALICVGREMVNVTTTVRGEEEWPMIPGLWTTAVHDLAVVLEDEIRSN